MEVAFGVQGWTPLHHAAFHGDAVAISALLSHGADIAAECHQVSSLIMRDALDSAFERQPLFANM